MRAKHLLWTILLNIFLLCAVSVLMEYNSLQKRFQRLENLIKTSAETATDLSMASEELFSSEYGDYRAKLMSQSGAKNRGADIQVNANTRWYSNEDASWINCSSYFLAMYYDEASKVGGAGQASLSYFPKNEMNYTAFVDDKISHETYGQDAIYKWLFGGIGEIYTSPYLNWSSTNERTKAVVDAQGLSGSDSARAATEDFQEFYDNVGSKMKATQIVKHRKPRNTSMYKTYNDATWDIVGEYYELEEDKWTFENTSYTFPTLAQMGLNLDKTGVNSKASNYMLDNFCMTRHVGKRRESDYPQVTVDDLTADSVYYLTPYTLGVTYVPTKVAKPLFMAHLTELCRWTKLQRGDLQNPDFAGDTSSVEQDAAGNSLNTRRTMDEEENIYSADGCIVSDVYNNGHLIKHADGADDEIVNDGMIEYDMSTVKMKVDYKVMDFYKDTNYIMVNKVLGSLSAYEKAGTKEASAHSNSEVDSLLRSLPDKLKVTDTKDAYHKKYNFTHQYGESDLGKRMVAQVTYKIKCYVPFESTILQYARYLESGGGADCENHMGLRAIKRIGSDYYLDDDGVWFQYTTYRAISR